MELLGKVVDETVGQKIVRRRGRALLVSGGLGRTQVLDLFGCHERGRSAEFVSTLILLEARSTAQLVKRHNIGVIKPAQDPRFADVPAARGRRTPLSSVGQAEFLEGLRLEEIELKLGQRFWRQRLNLLFDFERQRAKLCFH